MLEGLNDPENLGAVARSARAFGFDGLVLDPTCLDPYTRRTVRVSMGEILMTRWARVAGRRLAGGALTDTRRRRVRDMGDDAWRRTAPTSGRCDVPDRLAIVLGAEGPGLSACCTLDGDRRRVRIPIRDDVDSLNVAAAAAVAFAVVSRPR